MYYYMYYYYMYYYRKLQKSGKVRYDGTASTNSW